MDNLVNIYKSMEVASGVNIFVTQTVPSNKLHGEENNPEPDMLCGRDENGKTLKETTESHNQRRPERNGLKEPSKTNSKRSTSGPERPSFPTKKRVQVPEHPLPDTPIQPKKNESGLGEHTKAGPPRSVQKDRPSLNEKGDTLFSPFFWLREEEDGEKSSQPTAEDHLMVTPPDVPCFSDIKDSDDEVPSKMTPENGPCIASLPSHAVNLFDSEMFEWTQRACSPELCSSPTKMQVEETVRCDGLQEEQKFVSQGTVNNMGEMLEFRENNTKGTDKNIVDQPTSACRRTKYLNNEENTARPNKRSRKTSKSQQSKRVKKPKEIHIDSKDVAEADTKEEKCAKKGQLKGKNTKRDKMVSLNTNAVDMMPEDFSTLTEVAKPIDMGRRPMVPDVSVSLDKNEVIIGGYKLKSAAKDSNSNTIDQHRRDHTRRSKTQNMNFKDAKVQSQRNEVLISKPPKYSDLGAKTRDNENEHIMDPKCDIKSKKVKFSTECSKITSVDDIQSIPEKISAKKTPIAKLQGSLNVSYSDKLPKTENAHLILSRILRKCDTISNIIQCSFCQSMEDSEASGDMVHYLNGQPVMLEFNGGSNAIHVHKNCAEWAPNVYFEDDNAINLEVEIARSRRIKCCCCGLKGAALGCYEKSCRKSFHVPCAKFTPDCRWDNDNFVMLCPLHSSLDLPNEISESQIKRKKKCLPKRQPHNHQPQVVNKHDSGTSWRWNSHESFEKLVLCCSALTSAEKETVLEFEKLSGITVLKNWDSRVTHVIASTDENGACRRTLKFLIGILEGKWILSIEWVKACLIAKANVEEQHYEIGVDIHGIRDGPRLGRLRLQNKQPKLFNGHKFYFAGEFQPSYKGFLHDLVTAGGGKVLNRKPISGDDEFHSSTFVIYSLELPDKCKPSSSHLIINRRRSDAETLASSCQAAVATNSWILNSIAGCKLQTLAD